MRFRKLITPSIVTLILLLLAGLPLASQSSGGASVYLDPHQPIGRRVDDLLSRMTLKEKVGQLNLPCVYSASSGRISLPNLYSRIAEGIVRGAQGDNVADPDMVTHANGASGYIPDDDAYNQISYEITTTHLKPGCAESSIVNGFLH